MVTIAAFDPKKSAKHTSGIQCVLIVPTEKQSMSAGTTLVGHSRLSTSMNINGEDCKVSAKVVVRAGGV